MREIIFRGKRKDNGEWVQGDLIAYETGEVAILEQKFSKYGYEATEISNRTRVNPETIGQYTGLTDKNGKKIFEGDIISIPFEEDRSPYEENCVYYEDGEVYFDNEHYGWFVKFFDGETLSIWEYTEVEIVVIGNIHDNPELLKECEG